MTNLQASFGTLWQGGTTEARPMKVGEILLLAAALIGGAVFAADHAVLFAAPAQHVPPRIHDGACKVTEAGIKCRIEPVGIVPSWSGHA